MLTPLKPLFTLGKDAKVDLIRFGVATSKRIGSLYFCEIRAVGRMRKGCTRAGRDGRKNGRGCERKLKENRMHGERKMQER